MGHVYAAGVFIALAHDCKVMQSDRGWWCLNIHTKRNFTVALIEMTRYVIPLASRNALSIYNVCTIDPEGSLFTVYTVMTLDE